MHCQRTSGCQDRSSDLRWHSKHPVWRTSLLSGADATLACLYSPATQHRKQSLLPNCSPAQSLHCIILPTSTTVQAIIA